METTPLFYLFHSNEPVLLQLPLPAASDTFTHRELPVQEGEEDEHADNAEGEDVEDVGQEHLSLLVQTILTLLVSHGPQSRN